MKNMVPAMAKGKAGSGKVKGVSPFEFLYLCTLVEENDSVPL